MAVFPPTFGVAFFLIYSLAVGIDDGAGDDGGAGREIGADDTAIGGGVAVGGGGGGSIISSTFAIGSEMKYKNIFTRAFRLDLLAAVQ
jgi:hypothetical protein